MSKNEMVAGDPGKVVFTYSFVHATVPNTGMHFPRISANALCIKIKHAQRTYNIYHQNSLEASI